MVQAVVFDLFETLVSERWSGPAVGPPRWGGPSLPSTLGVPEDLFRPEWRRLRDRRMTSRLSYRESLREICDGLGVSLLDEVLDGLDEERGRAKDRALRLVDPAVMAMLADVRAAGVGVVVLSNCSVEEVRAWPASPLASLVDAAVWSCEIGVAKPDPKSYAVAADRVGVTVDRVLFVGDGSFDELRGACEAGARAVFASWFLTGWPAHAAETRRAEAAALGFPEAASPGELARMLQLM